MKITDKMLHFSISFLTVATISFFCYLLNLSSIWCYLLSNIITMGLGITKELLDSEWDWKDIIADVTGIITSDIFIAIFTIFSH